MSQILGRSRLSSTIVSICPSRLQQFQVGSKRTGADGRSAELTGGCGLSRRSSLASGATAGGGRHEAANALGTDRRFVPVLAAHSGRYGFGLYGKPGLASALGRLASRRRRHGRRRPSRPFSRLTRPLGHAGPVSPSRPAFSPGFSSLRPCWPLASKADSPAGRSIRIAPP